MSSPKLDSFDYAYIRVVPQIERDECINVGVLLFCRTRRFLCAQIQLNPARLLAFAPSLDLSEVERHLALIPQMCVGSGPVGSLGQAETFHWLVAPHNTVIQCSPVHSGLCQDPQEALSKLLATLS